MARAKRKTAEKYFFESVYEEVPHILDLLEALATIELTDTPESVRVWEQLRPNTVLASIEQRTRKLLVASGLKENSFLSYENLGDLHWLLEDPTITPTQRGRVELLTASMAVQWPTDLDKSRLNKLETLLYAAAALEMQAKHDAVVLGAKNASAKAAKVRIAKGEKTATKIQAIEADLIAQGKSKNINKEISKVLGNRSQTVQNIGRARLRKVAKKK